MTASGSTGAGIWQRWHLGAALAHLVLSLLFTWPLVLNLLPGSGPVVPGVMQEDIDQNLWNLWWVRYAALHGLNPFHTDMIWYPTGVSLYYHTLAIFNGLLAAPLLGFLPLTVVYNVVVLFSFVVAGYGAFLLVYYVCGNRWAALLGSAVFAYSAFHIATMRGLLQMISLEWIPFFVLFLLKALGGARWASRADFGGWLLRRALPASVFLFLVSLVDWYYTMYALMLAVMLLAYALVRELLRVGEMAGAAISGRLLQTGLRLVVPLLLWAIMMSPILVPMVRELRSNNYMQPSADEAISNSADLIAFFQPPRDHRLWGKPFAANRSRWPFASNRYEVYATYTALVLAGVALFATRIPRPMLNALGSGSEDAPTTGFGVPSKWFWAGCGLLFFLLALGPVLQVNGQQVRWLFSPDVGLPMPYDLIAGLPVLNVSRSPDRFDMPLSLCLGVLAGYGVNVLVRTGPPRTAVPVRGNAFAIAGLALLVLELAPMPYAQSKHEIAPWYFMLGKMTGDFSILNLPPQSDYWHGAFRMYYQTAHEKRILGGYISREYPHPFLTDTPGYQELRYADGTGDMFAAGPDEWYSAFEEYHTRYVVLENVRLPGVDEPHEDVSPSLAAIQHVLGPRAAPEYSDSQLEAFRVPPPANRVPFLSVGDGWEPREKNEQGQAFRWMHAEATLRIYSPRPEARYLVFKAASLGGPRQLVIYHGDQKVFERTIQEGLQEYQTSGPLGLPAGVSTLRLVSPQGTTSPAKLGTGSDPRELSFVLLSVELRPAP